MADLLLELFSEEIPARMQTQAAKDLHRLVQSALVDRGIYVEAYKAFAGPRRLTLAVAGVPAQGKDIEEDLKGPRTDAPKTAIDGFLSKNGLTLEQCEIRSDKKGSFYAAKKHFKGRATAEVLAKILPECFSKLPWPKSMRWPQEPSYLVTESGSYITTEEGDRITVESRTRWVRPLHGIVCMFDGEVVPFEFAGVQSGNATKGHRFLSSGTIEVRHYDDYVEKLRKAHVILDAEERKAIIFEAVKSAAFVHGLEMIPDEGLLDEVAGLAEWPVVLIGAVQDEFMDVPPEILQTSMRTHQKYFSLRDPKTGKMANRFALVANMIADDGGKEIVAGNERVLRARLSDAKFFWDQDRKRTLESRVDDLKNIVFHANAGTVYDRAWRISYLAEELARFALVDPVRAKQAGYLAKADLNSDLVNEFPELQGVMGGYFAESEGLNPDIVIAIRDHYLPDGQDDLPEGLFASVVAAAEKIDSLVSLWRAGERPTGSSDKFAQRRSALGLIRILLATKVRVSLSGAISLVLLYMNVQRNERWEHALRKNLSHDQFNPIVDELISYARKNLVGLTDTDMFADNATSKEVLEFLADRLKVALREKGTRHDLIDAVFSLGNEDDLVRLVARVEALQSFLKTDEGANLLAGYKRAANILKAEEKKDNAKFDGEPDAGLLALPEEKALGEALASASRSIADDVAAEKFVEAMGVMAKLRAPVDAFFDKVTVNDKDAKLRENRLKLLARLRATLHQVADFSKIEG